MKTLKKSLALPKFTESRVGKHGVLRFRPHPTPVHKAVVWIGEVGDQQPQILIWSWQNFGHKPEPHQI